jgi:hypothetical protein
MLRFWLIHHRRTTKPCSVFLPLPSVYRSNRPVTGPYRAVYRSVPNELVFQFEIWIFSVFSGNRGLLTGLPKPPTGGSGDRFGKLNPAPREGPPGVCAPRTPFYIIILSVSWYFRSWSGQRDVLITRRNAPGSQLVVSAGGKFDQFLCFVLEQNLQEFSLGCCLLER